MDCKLPFHTKLKSKIDISLIFTKGQTFSVYPIRVFFVTEEQQDNHQIAFAIPKKKFAKAHDRNQLKRLMREAFRTSTNKTPAVNNKKIIFLFTSSDLLSFNEIEKSMEKIFIKLNKQT